MKLKVNTKALIASTVALAVIPFTKATAETLEDWVARSVDEIMISNKAVKTNKLIPSNMVIH